MKTTQILASFAISAAVVLGEDNPYTQYPSVVKTASINGFADKIYDKVPVCAQECLKQSTGNTPCPYWDTGCLCVMPQFGGPIAQCIANHCQGLNVVSATSIAKQHCSAAGVWDPYWMIPSAGIVLLESAASKTVEVTANAAARTTLQTRARQTAVKAAIVPAPAVTAAPRA
jgi:hypothetical protein